MTAMAAAAYVDASALLAIVLREPAAPSVIRRLGAFPRLAAANLLEAEVRAAFAREGMDLAGSLPYGVEWIHPDRPLTAEIVTALRVGYLRGADLWHIAVALYLKENLAGTLAFITLDNRQRAVAAGLGFAAMAAA